MSGIACFLPCRSGSERVASKNTKPFCGFEYGLIDVKLRQLLNVGQIETIYLSTDDQAILGYAANIDNPKLVLHSRAKHLCLGSTPVEELVAHAHDITSNHAHILWTHVTTPFVNAAHYDAIIKAYFDACAEGHDSLMTTTPIQAFLWDDNGPINYDRGTEKWPRSQDLKPVHEVNFGVQMAARAVYAQYNDRIGVRPFLYPLNKFIGHDIDWPEDFQIAELMLQNELAEV